MRDVISAPARASIWAGNGYHQSPAIRAAGLIFCSGMLAINPETGEREREPLWSIVARHSGGLATAAIGGTIGAAALSRFTGSGKDAPSGAGAGSVGGDCNSGSSCGWIAFSNWTAIALVKW